MDADKLLDLLVYGLFGVPKDSGIEAKDREFAYYRAWLDHLVGTRFSCRCGIRAGEDGEDFYCNVWEAMKDVRDAEDKLQKAIANLEKSKESA